MLWQAVYFNVIAVVALYLVLAAIGSFIRVATP